VRAAIGASRRYVQPAGLVDEDLIALLERALEMAAAERSVTRVLLLSRLCGALYFSDRRERMAALADEATSIAAQLGDPRAAALAAAARRRAHWGPNQLARRLDDSTQLLAAATAAGDAELVLQGRAWLVVDLLERGDRGGAEVEIDAFAAGALALRQPLFLWNAEVWRAMLALLDGRLEESERLAASALAIGNRSDAVTAPQYYAIQLMGIRREQARMGELEAPLRAMIDANPARPAWRGALALLLSDAGRVDEARAQLELLVRDGLETISRDGDWLIAMTVLADAAAELEHRPAAATLYELLAPSAEAVVVIGLGSVCQGAAARYLGRLALTLGRRDEALAHLRRALSADTALRAPVALAYTQLHYAQALGDGPEARALIAAATAGAAERGLPRVLAQARRAAGS
jgi:tetratricopeptide (TPR) repeat protein